LRLRPGAVKGLFDREHVGVFGGLPDQFQHWRERVEWMMQQDIAVVDTLEDRVGIAKAARRERRVFQLRTLHQVVDLDHAIEVDRTVNAVDGVLGQLEVFQQRAHDRIGTIAGDLQPHRAQVAAADQLVTQRQREVLDFLLVDD
jgi:hypothetical protein